jgi:hypothetical protein
MIWGLFPSQWSQPVPKCRKPIKSLADRQFPPLPQNYPALNSIPQPAKIEKPKEVDRKLARYKTRKTELTKLAKQEPAQTAQKFQYAAIA